MIGNQTVGDTDNRVTMEATVLFLLIVIRIDLKLIIVRFSMFIVSRVKLGASHDDNLAMERHLKSEFMLSSL